MNKLNKSSNFLSDIKKIFLDDNNIRYRDFRIDQVKAENHYWELMGTCLQELENDEMVLNHFTDHLQKNFLHLFIDINTTIDKYVGHFNEMVRSVWEPNKEELDIFFAGWDANNKESLRNILNIINGAYIEGHKIEVHRKSVLIPLTIYDSYGSRMDQPVSEVFKRQYLKKFIINEDTDPKLRIPASYDRKLVRILHAEMRKIIKYNISVITYGIVFQPFKENCNLPFFKVKKRKPFSLDLE